MAIHRGIQSAIFYYLSCAPCSEARYRKKRKKEAELGRADREALYVEMPNVYRHPSPSSTNPHWATEIESGPTLSHRGRKKNANGGKDRDSSSRRALKSSMTQRSNDSAVPSAVSVDLRSSPSTDGRNDSKMQFQRYQRDDEELWGSKTSLGTERQESRAGGRIARPPTAHTRDPESYRRARMPPVNDHHPAVVTRVASKEEVQWMMQPPPTADVMSGKQSAARSRSGSGSSSRLSARTGVSLSREVSQRMVAQKLKTGELLPSPPLSRASTALSEHTAKGQRHDRPTTDEIDFAVAIDSPRKTKRKPSPIRIEFSEDSNDSTATVLRDPSKAAGRLQPKRAASRPQLSTIKSDSLIPSAADDKERNFYTSASSPRENSLSAYRQSYSDNTSTINKRSRLSRRTPLLFKDDALKVHQDLAPSSPLFSKRVVSTEDLPKQLPRWARLPSPDSSEETTLAGSPELYDSWASAELALPEWVHEQTKRDGIKKRWSMDI